MFSVFRTEEQSARQTEMVNRQRDGGFVVQQSTTKVSDTSLASYNCPCLLAAYKYRIPRLEAGIGPGPRTRSPDETPDRLP